MQAIQPRPTPSMRRWCRQCGLPSPLNQPGCMHCGDVMAPGRAVRNMSPIFNEGNGMVQNNVVNIDADEILDMLAEDAPATSAPSFGHRFFMFTMGVATWVGILAVLSVLAMLVFFVVLAVMKAHG